MIKKKNFYTFLKFMRSVNYKKGSRNMIFVLQKAELGNYVIGAKKMLFEIFKSDKKTAEIKKKREQKDFERLEFEEKERKMISKIRKMCTDDVQQKILSMKNFANDETGKFKNFWQHFKSRYIFKHGNAKGTIFNKLKEIEYEKCKFIEKYESLIRNIKSKIIDISLIVKQIIVLKFLNEFDISFNIYFTILNEQIRRKKKFSELNELLKNLKNEKSRMRQNLTATINVLRVKSKKVKKSLFEKRSEKSKKKNCNRCGKVHFKKCKHFNFICNGCGKKNHFELVCKSKAKNESNDALKF